MQVEQEEGEAEECGEERQKPRRRGGEPSTREKGEV